MQDGIKLQIAIGGSCHGAWHEILDHDIEDAVNFIADQTASRVRKVRKTAVQPIRMDCILPAKPQSGHPEKQNGSKLAVDALYALFAFQKARE